MKVEVLKFDGLYVAESGTVEGEVVLAGHGAVDGDFFYNYTRSERPTNRLNGDTCRRRIFSASTDSFQVTSSISGQTMGDIVMLYKYEEVFIKDATMKIAISAQQEASTADFNTSATYTPPGTAIITDGDPVSGTASQTYSFDIPTAVFAAKTAQGDAKILHNSEGEAGEIHTFYGITGTASYDALNTYDIDADSWAAGSAAASEKYDAQSCLIDNKIYENGGVSGGAGVKTTSEYNPSTDTWTAKTDAGDVRAGGDGVGFHDSVFFNHEGYDGAAAGIDTDTFYLPQNDTWYHFAVDVISTTKYRRFHWHNDYKAYAVGGYTFFGYYQGTNKLINFTSKSYNDGTSFPDSMAYISAASMDNYGLAVAGFDGTDTSDILYVWAEPRNTWVNVTTHADPGRYGRGSVG
jgi:hypothetical protein